MVLHKDGIKTAALQGMDINFKNTLNKTHSFKSRLPLHYLFHKHK